MDLDWCIVCDRHTSGGIYCSQICRNKDTPQELQGKAPVVPGPLDQKKLAFPLGMTYTSKRSTGYYNNNNSSNYGYSNSSNEEDSDSDEFSGANNINNNNIYYPSKPVASNKTNGFAVDNKHQPKKELLVSYGALTANTNVKTSNQTQNLKFLPRQQHHHSMAFQDQTARVF